MQRERNMQETNNNGQKENQKNPIDVNNSDSDNENKEPVEDQEAEKVKKENEELKDKKISEYGQTVLENNKKEHKIHLLSIIGEIEGHECLPSIIKPQNTNMSCHSWQP